MKWFKFLSISILTIIVMSCGIGDTTVPPGAVVNDDVELIAGTLKIGDGAHIKGKVEMTAGDLRIGEEVIIDDGLFVTAGKVKIGTGCDIYRIEMIAGLLETDKGTRIEKELEFVAGKIVLNGTEVGGGITINAGHLILGIGTVIENGIFFENSEVRNEDEDGNEDSQITVKKGAEVKGFIRVEREVDIVVEEGGIIPDEISGPANIIRR